MKKKIEFVAYGRMSSRLSKKHRPTGRSRLAALWRSPGRRVFLTFSYDLDESFVKMFRKKATQDTQLLIFNEGASIDRLMSRIVDLQIRTPQRFYVVDTSCGCGRSGAKGTFMDDLLKRLVVAHVADDGHERILDARIDDNLLHVVSSNFNRLDIPIVQIHDFKGREFSKIKEFEIDEDGSYIYWPKLDVHLGWRQLQQFINPQAALKALQKSHDFNKRYGKAVQRTREREGLKAGDIPELSEKQLRRIESGECRLTSNAIEILATAHNLEPNEYLKKLSAALNNVSL